MGNRLINEKIKVEGLKRKKRRMRLKAKGTGDAIIEKFIAQSSKSAKYAKTTVKKRDLSEAGKTSGIEVKRLEGPPSAGASHTNATPASANNQINVTPLDNPTSAGSAGGNVQATINSTNQ